MKKPIRRLLIPAVILLLCIMLPVFAAAEEAPVACLYNIDQVSASSGDITIRYTAEDTCFLATALYDGHGKLVDVDAQPVSAGHRQKVTATMPEQLPDSYGFKVFLLDRDTYAPLCPAKALEWVDDTSYNYNIIVLDVADGQVSAALSTEEACFLSIEILTEDGETVLNRTSLPVEGQLSMGSFYGDWTLSLPRYYIIRGVLKDEAGRLLCDPFINRDHTEDHEAFAALMETDFPESNLLDLQGENDGNFAVLNDDVTKLPLTGRQEDGLWVFDGALPADLQAGDKICFPTEDGTYETILIRSVSGTAITENTDTSLSDFYKLVKISVSAGNDVPEGAEVVEEMELMASSVKEEVAKIEMGPAIAVKIPLGEGITVNGSVKAGINLDFNYDSDRWGEKYFEYVCLYKYETKLGMTIGPNITYEKHIHLAELTFAGLKDVASVSSVIEMIPSIECKAEYGPELTFTSTSGYIYNSVDGARTVNEKHTGSAVATLKGEVELKAGIRAGLQASLLNDFVVANLGAEVGSAVKFTATASSDDLMAPSYHACKLCLAGKPYGYLEVDFTVDYDINPFLRGTLLDLDFYKVEWSMGEKYCSVLNEADSPFKGLWAYGSGTCPNQKHLIYFQTYLNDEQVYGYPITLKDGNGILVDNFTSTHHCYLYPGNYSVQSIIEGIPSKEAFTVAEDSMVVKLEANRYTLSGYVYDHDSGDPLAGVSVTATNHTETFGSATTDADGFYTMDLPEQTYTLTFSCEGYKTKTQSVELKQDSTCSTELVLKGAEGTVMGTVTDKRTGKSLGMASASATLDDGSTVTAPANGEGQFTMSLPSGESHTLTVSAPDYETATVSQAVEEAQTHTLSVQLQPKLCDITVKVQKPDGTPAEGATVSIADQNRTATTDGSGIASFKAYAGIYTVTAENSDYYVSSTIGIRSGLTVTLTLEENTMEWHYDETTHTLYIDGNGPMPLHEYKNYSYIAPWKDYSNDCQRVVVTGLSTISNYSFASFYNLTEVSLPDNLTGINDAAFYWCTSLAYIDIPNTVTALGISAFSHCSSLNGVTLPAGLTSLGNAAFSYCESLTGIDIPKGVTSIGYEAFGSCYRLSSISLPNGLLVIDDLAFSECSSLTSIQIPSTVSHIGWYAFQYSAISSVTIPDGITRISPYAFYGCTNLTHVSIPASVTDIAKRAFDNCYNLQYVYYGGSRQIWEESIGFYLPEGCILAFGS